LFRQAVVELLKKQLTSPVLWEPSMQKMISVTVAMWIFGARGSTLQGIWIGRKSCGFPKFPKHPSPTGTKSEMIFLGLIKIDDCRFQLLKAGFMANIMWFSY
jgi:hypothetical protein